MLAMYNLVFDHFICSSQNSLYEFLMASNKLTLHLYCHQDISSDDVTHHAVNVTSTTGINDDDSSSWDWGVPHHHRHLSSSFYHLQLLRVPSHPSPSLALPNLHLHRNRTRNPLLNQSLPPPPLLLPPPISSH